jgi:hypothetical protein
MRPETGGAHKLRDEEASECGDGVRAKSRVHEVEPNDIWPNFAHRTQYPYRITYRTNSPAATNLEARQFGLRRLSSRIHISQNGEVGALAAKFLCEVEAVFTEMVPARWKRSDEANSHRSPCIREIHYSPVTRVENVSRYRMKILIETNVNCHQPVNCRQA